VEALAEPLRLAISCVTPSVLVNSSARTQAGTQTLSIAAGRAVPLGGSPRLLLYLSHTVILAEAANEPRRWSAATAGYVYQFLDEANERELLAYHWHARGASPIVWPHLHVPGPVAPIDLSRAHLPTGPASLPAVLRWAISDLGVRPLRPDWPAVLAAADRALAGAAD
jgi:hypothetical protein